MKSINIIYKGENDLIGIRDEVLSRSPDHTLIQVFCGTADMGTVTRLRLTLIDFFPGTPIIGASTAGEIINARSLEHSIVISVSLFNHTRVQSVLVDQNADLGAAGKAMGVALKERAPQAIIIFGSGFNKGILFNSFPFLEALNAEIDDVTIAGGQAGGYDEQDGRVFVFTEQAIAEDGFAGAALSGNHLCIHTDYSLGWIPMGKKMTITDAEGNRVFSVDHKSVKNIYKEYLGIESGPSSLLMINNFPLMGDRDHVLATNPISAVNQDGSFDFVRKFQMGEQVRFSICDPALQEQEARRLHRTLSECNPQAVFIYSCTSRKAIFGDDVLIDLEALSSCQRSSGFFTYGEYYTDTCRRPHLFLQTMTVLALSEADICPVRSAHIPGTQSPSKADSRRFRLMKAMNHLVASTTRELEAKNRELRILASIDALTGLANRRLFDEMLVSKFKDHSRSDALLSLMLLDVDFFKQFNDIYGHVAGDDCLRGISQILLREVKRTSDFAFRYGGEEFGCILSFTDHDGALTVAESIRNDVERLSIPHKGSNVNKNVTISIGALTTKCNPEMSPQGIIRNCDDLLYQAKQNGRNRVVGREIC